jgi:hypothetical protein
MQLIGLAVALALSLTLVPLAGDAQRPSAVRRIGYLQADTGLYVGNLVLTGIGRLVFATDTRDFHCGLRGFRRDDILDLCLGGRSGGRGPGVEGRTSRPLSFLCSPCGCRGLT